MMYFSVTVKETMNGKIVDMRGKPTERHVRRYREKYPDADIYLNGKKLVFEKSPEEMALERFREKDDT